MELNDPDLAEGFYMRALGMKEKLVGSDENWEIPTYYEQIAQVHERRGMNMEAKFFGAFFNKSKITSENEEAVKWMKKALDLQGRLGVSDTDHTATLQRNLANSLVGLKKYDEAFEYANKCYENRKQRLGEHPDTVRILYLTGIIHEWREDIKKACETYEKAFEMEEALPEYNHSVRRLDIRRRLKKMYKKLMLKKELQEFEMRIKEIEETKKEMPSPAEVFITVNQQGGKYNHLAKGFLLDFPPECVTEATRIHFEASLSKSNLPSPNDSTESLVSYIVELGPDSIQLKKPFVMTLLHCGVSESEGYETKVKVFNTESKVWEEAEELPQVSQPPENIPYKLTKFIQVNLRKMSAVAVVSRLITTTFEVPISGGVVKSKIFSDVTVTFPEGAVDRTVKGGLQVIPIPDHVAKDSEAIPCPVLLFSGFSNVLFSKPVNITVPRPLHSKCTDVRVFRLDDVRTPPFLWKDITTKDIIVDTKKNAITIQVKRFSGYWILVSMSGDEEKVPKDLKDLPDKLYRRLNNSPSYVSFAAYQNAGTSTISKIDLKLTCVANHMQHDLTMKLKGEDYLFLKSATSCEPMRKHEEAFPYFEGDGNFRLDVKDPLKFTGPEDWAFQKIIVLETKLREIRLSFHRDKEKTKFLCKLPLEKKKDNNSYYRDGPDSSNAYKMKSIPRGLMFVIDIRKFDADSSLEERTDTKDDVDNLKKLFDGRFQFLVLNLETAKKTSDQLLKELKIVNSPEYNDYDCFALCIMSHGNGSELYNYYGKTIKISDIFNMFSKSMCENFRGKPKLFFIQGCLLEDKKPPQTYGPKTKGRSDSIPPNEMADMLRVCCPEEGGVFIKTLVSVFKEDAEQEDILTMIKNVKRRMSSQALFVTYEDTLSPKKLYFNPREPFEEES